MIETEKDTHFRDTLYITLSCDHCSFVEEIEWDDTFSNFIESKKNEGWIMYRVNDEWRHKCPDCGSPAADFGPMNGN